MYHCRTTDCVGKVRMRLPPPSFNVLGELRDCANPARGKARRRNGFEQSAQECVRSIGQWRLRRNPPLLPIQFSNPIGVQITASRVESSPIVRLDVRITIGDPVSWASPYGYGIKLGQKPVGLGYLGWGMVFVWVVWLGSTSALRSKLLSLVERAQNLVKIVGRLSVLKPSWNHRSVRLAG